MGAIAATDAIYFQSFLKSLNSTYRYFLLMAIGILLSTCTSRQNSDAPADNGTRKSPIAIASVKHNNTYIKVVYGQPYKRGRVVFGELAPYGEVWRTGANEATEITITESVLMGEQVVYPGTYALFTIPNSDEWTIILNNGLGQWGAFNYDEKRDYARMNFPAKKIDKTVEAFTIEFSPPERSLTVMTLKWDDVQVDVPIRFY